jgi:SOS-response transcriptional repressor LexA
MKKAHATAPRPLSKVTLMPDVRTTEIRTRPGLKIEAERFIAFKLHSAALQDKGIFTSDRLIAYKADDFTSGELIIAEYAGCEIVRYAFKEAEGIRLESGNKKFPTLTVDPSMLEVEGVVIRVERDL